MYLLFRASWQKVIRPSTSFPPPPLIMPYGGFSPSANLILKPVTFQVQQFGPFLKLGEIHDAFTQAEPRWVTMHWARMKMDELGGQNVQNQLFKTADFRSLGYRVRLHTRSS